MAESVVEQSGESVQLCRLKLSAAGFGAAWRHCDLLSNYVARSVSFSKPDPFAFSNLLSTVINEVFEAIYWQHDDAGQIEVAVHRVGTDTVITAEVPVDEEARAFYLAISDDLTQKNPDALFKNEILSEGDVSRAIGFYELAATYRADVQISPVGEKSSMKIVVRVGLDHFLEELM